jgi:REP element-mobilizing transposase RayT
MHMDVLNKPGHAALRKGRVSLAGQIYLITSTTYKREPWFADFNCAAAAARHFESVVPADQATLLAWVLMPDHAHWLLQLSDGSSLPLLVNRIKSASAREVNRLLKRSGAIWDVGFHDRALRRDEDVKVVARYIIANPIRAGLVKQVGDYPLWNVIWL